LNIFSTIERECLAKPMAVDALMIQKAIQKKRIVVRPLRGEKLQRELLADFPMGQGEAEPIALALANKGKLVGIDDRAGINACKLLQIPF
jgi:predicted nucleic acid-binding protein